MQVKVHYVESMGAGVKCANTAVAGVAAFIVLLLSLLKRRWSSLARVTTWSQSPSGSDASCWGGKLDLNLSIISLRDLSIISTKILMS